MGTGIQEHDTHRHTHNGGGELVQASVPHTYDEEITQNTEIQSNLHSL